ncbi:mRNA transport factor Gfd1p [Monosporozyma unispora]|nr:hypothetical protein C6P44_002579 [Kazachstania unispora]
MPLESKWADAPDEDNLNELKHRSPRVSRSNSRHQTPSNDIKQKSSGNMMGGHQIGFARVKDTGSKSRSISPQKKKSPTSRPATSSSLEGRIMPNFLDERESMTPVRTKSPTPEHEQSPSKLELLKKKIAEQKTIREHKHKEQQQQLLEDFLNDDSATLNWDEDDEEDDKLLERINKLKV